METNTVYSEDSRQRIQNKIASAVKTKLMGNGVENADELSVKFTEMMAAGHSKEEVLSELEKYSKVDERHNKSFVDWLFGYSSVVAVVQPKEKTNDHNTPLTEADTEMTTENQLNSQPSSVPTPPIDDVTEDEDDEEKENKEELVEEDNLDKKTSPVAIAESVLNQQENDEAENDKVLDDDIEEDDDISSDESDDPPELQSNDSEDEQIEEQHEEQHEEQKEPVTEEAKVETEAAESGKDKVEEEPEKKPELPKKRSFIRIKEGKSGRFTPIKSEDRHSFVKRNLARVATQLDMAIQVQKKMMAHAVAVANASENSTLSKKKSTASLSSTTSLEKKKSFRRDSINSNSSSTPSVYSSTNPTFIQSFAGKTFPKQNKVVTPTSTISNINASTVTPDKSKAVRCSYWPNCNRGDECKFWHPKELCPHLNNCPDGDQCLYIHPAIPQSQLNKAKKKKSESTLELTEKHTLQKKLSKRDSMLSLNSTQTLLKKSSKANIKEAMNATANSSFAVECKYGANCTRPDCKFSHPSPAAILAAAKKKAETTVLLKKKDSKIKEKKSHDILKHKESRSKLFSENEEQSILCHFDPNCNRTNCKFMHTNK